MPYIPTVQEAIVVYIAAVADHYRLPPDTIDWPRLDDVRETVQGTFTIRANQGIGGRDQIHNDRAVAMYDEENELWIVRLEDGIIVIVRKVGHGDNAIFTVE